VEKVPYSHRYRLLAEGYLAVTQALDNLLEGVGLKAA